ncbi:uncharacterized protein cubi_01507 [Cryptosporidium ubiquitum]|uniref:Uncharacterized protein n=1 Tax=Cryptosporidium ubiquitum TaxID=857276 RepID=A0A1J4MD77_9CRYT|nr:uncharacterized protein cubi_01507 [Cryptosporidium ubiquitum]OII72174.1 hypothetical protein cubi_01507 [Cryptosporidium ubiquitum]
MKAVRRHIYSRLSLILILISLLLKITKCTNGPNKSSGNPIVTRPGITTRSSSEGLGRTYDKGVKDTLSLLEQYYDGTDDWRRYNVVNPSMKNSHENGPTSENDDNTDLNPDSESIIPKESGKAPEVSAVAQTPADYKLPDAVIPLTKNKESLVQSKKPNLTDTVDQDPSLDKGPLSDGMSEDQTEVLSVSEGPSEGADYEYTGGSEGFGPPDMGYEAISEQYDPNGESYSYRDAGDEPDGQYPYSYKLESELENVDPGMSYIMMDENADENAPNYIYKDGSENFQEHPGTEYDYVGEHENNDEGSIRYISEHGNDSDFEERHINEAGDEGFSGTENVYIDDVDPNETEYEYIGEGDRSETSIGGEEAEGSEGKNGKRRKRKHSKRHQKKPKLPKKWDTFTENEKQEWLDRHPRTRQIFNEQFEENNLSGRRPRRSRNGDGFDPLEDNKLSGRRPRRSRNGDGFEPLEDNKLSGRRPRRSRNGNSFEPLDKRSNLANRGGRQRAGGYEDEEPVLNRRRRRGRRSKGGDILDDDLGFSRSGRRRRRGRQELIDSPRMKNRRGRRRGGYDLIQDIKGDPYLTTVGERVLSKYPVNKRDNILKLRDSALRDIKKGRRPKGDFEEIIDPVDLMLIYRDANKMPLLVVKNEGNIPLEYMLKLPKGLYLWEEIDPEERARLKSKWKEEIEKGTFWDDDKLHGDWSDEVKLLGEWGEEETIRGIMGREISPGNQMGEEYSYYSFVPKFTDLRNKGVFSGEYPEDIEHLILVGDMLPEDKFQGEFKVPELQLLRFHPRFEHLDDLDDFVLENIQSRRNEGPIYLPTHRPSWMEYRTTGAFGKGIPVDKYSWLESLDRDDALRLIEEANYGDPDFNEKLLIKYPWIRDRLGEAIYSDDGLVLPIQVLNEFIPRSVYNLAKEDEKYPGSKWYFSEVPSDINLGKFITDIYERAGPNIGYRSHKRNPYLEAGLENLFEERINLDGWDRETINYLRELFRDAENREIELQEELDGYNSMNKNGSMFPGSGRRRRHRLRSSRPDMPIWYFGTEEQRDRERRLEFAIESDSAGGIIEEKPSSTRKIFLDPTGRRPEGILSLELQDISDNPEYDVESLGISEADYFDDDDDLNLEMMGSYPSSRTSPTRIKNIYFNNIPGGKYSDIDSGIYPINYPGRMHKGLKGQHPGFNPIRRYVFNDDDIDTHSPLSISQSDFLQESSGFNERNPFLIGRAFKVNRDDWNRPWKPGKMKRNGKLGIKKSHPRSHKVNEFGQEDPMEIIRDYYDLNESSILDVLDGKGIYRPKKKKVGYGVSDLDYLRRSNDDDWNYMKKLRETNSSKPRSKKDNKPLWYYYDTIGRRWDDSLADEDESMDSYIDLVLKELQTKKRDNKKGGNAKNKKHKNGRFVDIKGRPKHQDEYEEDYSVIEIEDKKGRGKKKSKRRGSKKRRGKDKSMKGKSKKGKRVSFKLHPEDQESDTSDSLSETSTIETDFSQSRSKNLSEESELSDVSKSGSEEESEDFEELGPLAKRILMAAGYDDDLDPTVPLSIETEILELVDTGKKGRKIRRKQKKGNKSKKDEADDLLSLENMLEANKKIKVDMHDLSEIRRMRRDLNDDSGDLEALKTLIKKLHLDELIDLSDDSSSEVSQDSEPISSELERSETEGESETEASLSKDSEEKSEDDQTIEDNVKKPNVKPLKILKIKRNKKGSKIDLGKDSSSEEASTSTSVDNLESMEPSQTDEEFTLSEWDSFIHEKLKEVESKPEKSKSDGKKNKSKKKGKNSRRKKGLKKSREEKKALLNLGIDPKTIQRINMLLKDKDDGIKNALEYLLDELENNLEDSQEPRSGGKRSRGKKRKNSKRRRRENATRRPYDLEPVTPPFSRYILKLKDVLGPKEALEELLDNLGVELSGEEPVPKELRRYITPNVVNEVRVLRDKKNGDERALNKLLKVLRIPNKRVSRPERSNHKRGQIGKEGRRLPALLNEEDIKAVNRLLKRNKAPQALEYFLKSTDLDKDLEDNSQGIYRPNRSYSGLNLSPERLSKVRYLIDQGPQGCRDALSEIFDDLGIPKQKNLFDGSRNGLELMDPQSRRPLKRNRQRRMAMPPYLRDPELDYSEDGYINGDDYSEFDDFSTFVPREYYRFNDGRKVYTEDPMKMLPFGKANVAPNTYEVLPTPKSPFPLEDQYYKTLIDHPIMRNDMSLSPRYYKAPEMSQYDRDLRDFVNKRRKGFGMPNIPDYQYWNYDPEITGRSVYEGLDTPTNRRRRQILERKRKLGNYLDEEHEVSVPLEDGENDMGRENSSKTIMVKSFVDDDLPENSEEVMLVHKPEYSEEELYDMGQCLVNNEDSNKLKISNGAEISNNLNAEFEGLKNIEDGFEVEREATREEILSTLVTDPKMEVSTKLILREISDDDDSVINKFRNILMENPMMERSNIPKPVESAEKLKEMQKQTPESKEIQSFGYLDPSLSSYDKKLYSDSFVESLEKENLETTPISISSQMLEECKDIASQLKMKELGCEKISGDASESRKRPLDIRRLSKRVTKVKNLYVKSFLKQICFPGEVAKLYIERFSDLKGWNKAMDRHRWVALPLVSPQSYIPNLGGLNLFQRMILHQTVKKQKLHSPRRVIILAFSTRSVAEKKLPNNLASLGEYSGKKNSVSSLEYSMNVEYNQGMLIVPLIELALCVKGALQLNNIVSSNKSKKIKLGTCIIGGVRSHSVAQKIYRTALKYLEMSPDLSMAKFLIIPVKVGKENLSEQLKLSESGNTDKNFGLQIPEDAISPAVSDLEYSKLQFEMKLENSKQVKERYNNKLANLSEAIFKLYLMNSRELDIRSLKANGPRSIVIPMSFPQLYIKGYSRAQKLVKKIQNKYKPSLKNRSYRNKLKPGFILLINDQTVNSGSNSKSFLNEQIKRIQSFFTNPYSFKNFKSRKHEGPVLEIKGVNTLQIRKFLLDAISRASRQPSVVPMVILPIFVDNNLKTNKSDRKAMNKVSKKNIKHSNNI